MNGKRYAARFGRARGKTAAAVILTAAAVILSAPAAPASAATWTPPDGATVTSVRVTRGPVHHGWRTVRTRIRYQLRHEWTPTHEDLIGSVECRADSQTIVESDWWVDERANTIRRDHVQTLTGTCRILNVTITPASRPADGFEWATSWTQTQDIDPVGQWYVPWEVEGIETLPVIPWWSEHMATVRTRVR